MTPEDMAALASEIDSIRLSLNILLEFGDQKFLSYATAQKQLGLAATALLDYHNLGVGQKFAMGFAHDCSKRPCCAAAFAEWCARIAACSPPHSEPKSIRFAYRSFPCWSTKTRSSPLTPPRKGIRPCVHQLVGFPQPRRGREVGVAIRVRRLGESAQRAEIVW